jgi:hypothetical protein
MISNERPSPYGRRPRRPPPVNKPSLPEETIKTEKVHIERKTFVFTLKENARGRFLRITEDVNGRRDTIIIPATGLGEFRRLFENMVQASVDIPSKPPPATEHTEEHCQEDEQRWAERRAVPPPSAQSLPPGHEVG